MVRATWQGLGPETMKAFFEPSRSNSIVRIEVIDTPSRRIVLVHHMDVDWTTPGAVFDLFDQVAAGYPDAVIRNSSYVMDRELDLFQRWCRHRPDVLTQVHDACGATDASPVIP